MVWLWGMALLGQLAQDQLYWTYTGPDRNRQLVAAASALEGHGMSEPHWDPGAGGLVYEPLVAWPPGYSRLAQVAWLLWQDWWLAARWLSGISAACVVLGAWALFRSLPLRPAWRGEALLLLFWTVSFSPFHHLTDTDAFALGAALLASALMLRQPQSIRNKILALLCLGLAAWFRIAYLPFFLLPGLLAWVRRRSWLPGLPAAGLLLLGACLAGGYLWLFAPRHPVSGDAGSLLAASQWFPDNLLRWDAFALKAWAYFSAEAFVSKLGDWVRWPVHLFVGLANGWLCYTFIRQFRYSQQAPSSAFSFHLLTLLVAVFTLGFLGWLSLRSPAEVHDGSRLWTYVMETRYYAWLLVLIQLWWLMAAFPEGGVGWRMGKRVLLGLMLLGVLHGGYRHAAALCLPQHSATAWSAEEQDALVLFEKTANIRGRVWVMPGRDIRERDLATMATLAGALPWPDSASQPALLPGDTLIAWEQDSNLFP